MKKAFTLMVAVLVLFTIACKKDSTTKKAASGENSWILDGVTYKTGITSRANTSGGDKTTLINFWTAVPTSDFRVNGVSVSFATVPTASGTLKLKGGVGGTLTANQFELAASTLTKTYAYLGADVDITVTVTGGKVKVVIPEITLKCTTSDPDVKLSGTVQEL
ncbi:hypothetical protein [Mucilaginibacter flavidus]|uniref:hypothetical protein n=1 Tax=Mucilaginibacter flavidus TaxID=2949309 RepID=UPI0020930968|nr:hypothetical protein [Mucilaginibacter flavidus]MCO5948823.1 hypothetical protein [Mucilaginibacter flavidus]